VRSLLQAGHEPLIFDDLSTGFLDGLPKDVSFIKGDILNFEFLEKTIRDFKPDGVIHFAGKTVVPDSVKFGLPYYGTNVAGSYYLLKAMASTPSVKHLIFSSSAAVYGNPDHNPVSETATLRPMSPYAFQKMTMERMIQDCASSIGISYVILRYFNVAGAMSDLSAGQRTQGATHLIKVAAEAACGIRPSLSVFGTDYPTRDGTGVRDFIHVEDF